MCLDKVAGHDLHFILVGMPVLLIIYIRDKFRECVHEHPI